jgi:two-component system, OmpR family, sensor histidine kinase KdpD
MTLASSGKIGRSLALAGTSLCPLLITSLLLPLRDWISPTDVAMLQLLWIAWMAQRFGKGWAIATTVVSVLLLNWCFVAPYYTLHVADPSNLISFVVMLSLGIFISYLSDQHQHRLRKTRLAMSQMRAMYMLAKGVNAYSDWTAQCQYASRLLTRRLKAKVQLQASPKQPQTSSGTIVLPLGKPQIAGWIIVSETVYRPHQPLINAAQSLLSQNASALQLKQQAQQQQLQVELERHRAMLLRSLSHDLRTPLATIMGASSMLADPDLTLTLEQRQQQATNIYQQSKLLDLHFEKVLELSKAQLSGDSLQFATFSSDELIAGALARRADLTAIVRRDFKLSAPLPLTGNPDLLEIALANMLENAIRYGQAPFFLQLSQQQSTSSQHHNFRLVLQHRLASQPSPAVPDRSHGLGTLICQTVAALHRGQFRLLLPQSVTNDDGCPGEVSAELEWQA